MDWLETQEQAKLMYDNINKNSVCLSSLEAEYQGVQVYLLG